MIKYIPWAPIDNLEGYFWFLGLVDDIEAGYDLVLKFSPENSEKILQVSFKNPLTYEKTSSFDFVRSGEKFNGVFVQVENSPLLNWFIYMSHENYKSATIKHYSFRTVNYIIDVLTKDDIQVEWLPENKID